MINEKEIADKLVEALFETGSEPNSPCNRIQFMGGCWRDGSEVGQGGFVKDALKRYFEKRLIRIMKDDSKN